MLFSMIKNNYKLLSRVALVKVVTAGLYTKLRPKYLTQFLYDWPRLKTTASIQRVTTERCVGRLSKFKNIIVVNDNL